ISNRQMAMAYGHHNPRRDCRRILCAGPARPALLSQGAGFRGWRSIGTDTSPLFSPRTDFDMKSSAARHRIDVLNRARQRQRRPGLSAVVGAEHLALIARAEIDLVWVGRMERHRHDRSVDLHLVKPTPRLPRVLAAIEPAVVARGGDAECRVDGL